jgi:uncharacterized OB-fold protein
MSESSERGAHVEVAGATIPAVTRDDASEAFFDAAARGRLSLRCCLRCQTILTLSARSCTACHGDALGECLVGGGATLISWVVVYDPPTPVLADCVPYVVGIVEVEGGPWMVARIVPADATLYVGADLEVRFIYSGSKEPGEAVPVFVVTSRTGTRDLVHGEPDSFIGGYSRQPRRLDAGSPELNVGGYGL